MQNVSSDEETDLVDGMISDVLFMPAAMLQIVHVNVVVHQASPVEAWLIFNFYDATTPKLLIAVLRSIASHGVSSDRVSSTRPCQQTICNFISEM
jgi:hypothetical protein